MRQRVHKGLLLGWLPVPGPAARAHEGIRERDIQELEGFRMDNWVSEGVAGEGHGKIPGE